MISKSALKSGGATVLSGLVTYILVRGVIEICELSFKLGKTVYKNRKNRKSISLQKIEEKVFDNFEKLSAEEQSELLSQFSAYTTPEGIKTFEKFSEKLLEAYGYDAKTVNPDEKNQVSELDQNFAKSFLVKINSKAVGLGASAASIAKKIHF
jgi:hypothetical protein